MSVLRRRRESIATFKPLHPLPGEAVHPVLPRPHETFREEIEKGDWAPVLDQGGRHVGDAERVLGVTRRRLTRVVATHCGPMWVDPTAAQGKRGLAGFFMIGDELSLLGEPVTHPDGVKRQLVRATIAGSSREGWAEWEAWGRVTGLT